MKSYWSVWKVASMVYEVVVGVVEEIKEEEEVEVVMRGLDVYLITAISPSSPPSLPAGTP